MPSRLDINDMRDAAKRNDGKCLSMMYFDEHTTLMWMCRRGHTWDAPYSVIRQGAWCRQCENKEYFLERIKTIAKTKGGICLSKEYINSHTPLKFQCAKGHKWTTQPHNVKSGKWCPQCGRTWLLIDEFQELAKKKGGKCLSDSFNGIYKIMRWQCSKGHQFEATPAAIKYTPQFCPVCANHVYHTIEEMHEIAKVKRGKCLSDEFVNSSHPLKWKCNKGHIWKASYRIIRHGSWCIQCKKNDLLNEIQAIAKSKKGECLSKEFINSKFRLKFQCAKKHQWMTSPGSIKAGYWCKVCAGTEKLTLDVFQKIAQEHGGKCLSSIYEIITKKLVWQCKMGHQWEATGTSVKLNHSWCRICSNKENGQNQRLPFSVFQEIARKYKGRILTEEKDYMNVLTSMKCQCGHGHVWETKAAYIRTGSWCPVCAGKKVYTLDDMHKYAKSKGGTCLSEIYFNLQTKLKWKCANGHQWMAKPSSIASGSWCPLCAGTKRKTIADMHKLARTRNGKCLSTKYINTKTKLKWQCANGHQWMAIPNSIDSGKWCPFCAGTKRKTISDMHKLARTRNGKCLSTKYINNITKLKWQCANGHQWMAIPNSIASGKWCPLCARTKRKTIADMHK